MKTNKTNAKKLTTETIRFLNHIEREQSKLVSENKFLSQKIENQKIELENQIKILTEKNLKLVSENSELIIENSKLFNCRNQFLDISKKLLKK
jgi:hypothetical protein